MATKEGEQRICSEDDVEDVSAHQPVTNHNFILLEEVSKYKMKCMTSYIMQMVLGCGRIFVLLFGDEEKRFCKPHTCYFVAHQYRNSSLQMLGYYLLDKSLVTTNDNVFWQYAILNKCYWDINIFVCVCS